MAKNEKYTDAERAEYWKKRALEGGNGGGSRSSRSSGSSRNDKPEKPKKYSGCEAGKDKNDNPYVRGWKYDKTNGLRSFYACPYSGGAKGGTKRVTSQEGVIWENWMVRVQKTGVPDYIVSGMYDVAKKRVIIKELSFVMNPKGGKGGYVGPFFERKD